MRDAFGQRIGRRPLFGSLSRGWIIAEEFSSPDLELHWLDEDADPRATEAALEGRVKLGALTLNEMRGARECLDSEVRRCEAARSFANFGIVTDTG